MDGVSVADVAGKGQSHIHPALRIDTSCAPKGQPVGQLGEVVEVAGEERGEMEVGLGIKGLDLAV